MILAVRPQIELPYVLAGQLRSPERRELRGSKQIYGSSMLMSGRDRGVCFWMLTSYNVLIDLEISTRSRAFERQKLGQLFVFLGLHDGHSYRGVPGQLCNLL